MSTPMNWWDVISVCLDCGNTFASDGDDIECTECGSLNIEIIECPDDDFEDDDEC